MRKIIKYGLILLILFTVIGLNACTDVYSGLETPEDINLTVSAVPDTTEIDSETGAYVVNLGSKVTFKFAGNRVDNILFYSGTIGNEYRYRARTLAENVANIKPTILIKTGLTVVPPTNGEVKSSFTFGYTNELNEFTDQAVTNAVWKESAVALRGGNLVNNAAVTQYFYPNLGLDAATNKVDDWTDWYSNDYVVYRIKAKSNASDNYRLNLQQFDVKNTETRDYSFTYNGVEKTVTKTINYQIFKAFCLFGTTLAVANDMTAACWAQYVPLTTIKEGESTPVPNSQYYVWNLPELGLKYGEGSGYPWVTKNKYGYAISCAYAATTQVSVPAAVTDSGGNIIFPTATEKAEPSESWLISRKHYTRQVSPDSPTSFLKTKTVNMIREYRHQFTASGLYTVTFYMNNQNIDVTKEKVVEFKIMVR
ncbi:MAG: DUF5017 domain-containing protein [Paludibacter sp.]|nr:DUF5017 domain-containing protein [Paludibacter sp.]